MKRLITFVEAIREATDQSMSRDKNVILFGLGQMILNLFLVQQLT